MDGLDADDGRSIQATPLKRWTEDEIRILRERFAEVPAKDLAAELPGRTPTAIMAMARKIGICGNKLAEVRLGSWTDEEIRILKERYMTTLNDDLVALRPGRTLPAIEYALRQAAERRAASCRQ